MLKTVSNKIYCPLLQKEVEDGYCWELCNIGTDDILLDGDVVTYWDKAQKICEKCGRYYEKTAASVSLQRHGGERGI